MSAILTEKELKALELTSALWNALLDLDAEYSHPDDIHEHRRDIHDIQNRVMSRAAIRKNFNHSKPTSDVQ